MTQFLILCASITLTLAYCASIPVAEWNRTGLTQGARPIPGVHSRRCVREQAAGAACMCFQIKGRV